MLIINPKRVTESIEVKPFWYNYYAGYSHTFTQKIIESAKLPPNATILDPWNGAGTTTMMASVNGFHSIGVDLNPVMKVIASAKQATKNDTRDVTTILNSINGSHKNMVGTDDPLEYWIEKNTTSFVRKIEQCILAGENYVSTEEKVYSLTNAQCLMYTALFNCIRDLLGNFIPSNPTWIKKPKTNVNKIEMPWLTLKKRYVSYAEDMVKGLSVVEHDWSEEIADIIIGSSDDMQIESSSIDMVLTSPPYCTRIDYGVATLPELSILCIGGEEEIDSIRRNLMGTTTVPKILDGQISNLTKQCIEFLENVKSHVSKASNTYYFKNLAQYFFSLESSIKEIDRVLKNKCKFICVVQDSFYKDIRCDLPGILVEMAESNNLHLIDKIEFESKRYMGNLNLKSKRYRKTSIAFENVLIFEKG